MKLKNYLNESVQFSKYQSVVLKQNLGDVAKGTVFYCEKISNDTVTLCKQDDSNYKITLPSSFAENMFDELPTLEIGKTYTTAYDIRYVPIKYVDDYEWSQKFIDKYTDKDYIVFKKGTKFKYIGSDEGEDVFEIDGQNVPITFYENLVKNVDIDNPLQLFKETKGSYK